MVVSKFAILGDFLTSWLGMPILARLLSQHSFLQHEQPFGSRVALECFYSIIKWMMILNQRAQAIIKHMGVNLRR